MSRSVLTPAEALEELSWPELETVEHFHLEPEDWVVCCAGFEDRASRVLQNASEDGGAFRVALVQYRPTLLENRAGLFQNICQTAGIQPAGLVYDCQDPAGFGSRLLEILADRSGRVFVDVSGMSRLLIAQTLVALGTGPRGFSDCFVAYAEAEVYSPTQAEAESELAKQEVDPTFSIQFLSSGVFEITVVPELSSFAMAGAQTRLIAFPSLDEHHLIALQTELQPSRLSFIEGIPPGDQNRWRKEFIAKVNHLNEMRKSSGERFEVSTLDYRETLHCLLQIYREHALRERLLLAPTGSKLQTVAVGVFRALVRDVQIVYPTPRGFRRPDDYTRGVGLVHTLDLGRFVLPES